MQVPSKMNWGVKYDTNIMTLPLEELKTNAAVTGANFDNSFSFGAITLSFLSLLLIAAHPCPCWKLTTAHSTKPGNTHGVTVGHKAEL